MKKYRLIGVALLVFAIHGCNSWLDVQPIDRQTESQVYATKGGFYAAMNGIYGKLTTSALYGENLSYGMLEILAKRYQITDVNNKKYAAFMNYSYSDENVTTPIDDTWKTAYSIILNCNIVLSNAEIRKTMLGEKDYGIIKGEMLSLRAFLHFDMLRLFGPIYAKNPDVESIPYTVSSIGLPSKLLTAREVLETYILADIADAEQLLAKYDPVITDGRMAEDISDEEDIKNEGNRYRYRQLRFNYYALLALKARAQLYAGKNAEALATAKKLINNETIRSQFPPIESALIVTSTRPDRMFTSEVFFGMYNDRRSIVFDNFFDVEGASGNLLQPRRDFITNLFSGISADYRTKQWIVMDNTPNVEPTLAKYAAIGSSDFFYASFVPLIRYSEMYLIAAETEPVVADGLVHLNNLRVSMRGNVANPLVDITTKELLDNEILREYSREFYGEGQMFYYYKRRNIDIPEFNNGFNAEKVLLKDKSDRLAIPLPESETLYH